MIEQIISIASDPEAHKTRLAEFEARQEAAVKAEAAASSRIETADKREAEIAELETELQKHQTLVKAAVEFREHCRELVREMEKERLEQEKTNAQK